MQMASFTAVLKLKPLYDAMMGAAKVLKDSEKIPEYQTILDAYDKLREMQRAIYDLEEKLKNTEKAFKELSDAHASLEGSEIRHHLLWLKDDKLPRCLHCWEAENKLIHVIERPTGFVDCPRCKERTLSPAAGF
jgi:hypothetical protein